jgi:hypothetical protein
MSIRGKKLRVLRLLAAIANGEAMNGVSLAKKEMASISP